MNVIIRTGTLLVMVGMLAGCGNGSDSTPVAITETRMIGAPPNVPTNATTADRLLPHVHTHDTAGGGSGATGAADAAASAGVTWETPPGWTLGPARSMRVATFAAGPDGAVECYIAELSGMGGGSEANFNRWRGQLGQPPMAAGEFESLPKIRMLGQDAPLVQVEGTYRGMGDTEQPNSKLLGTLASAGERTFFVKMVGPSAAVDAQREAFMALCASLEAVE